MSDSEPRSKLRVKEAAARIGVSPRFMYHCINERRLKCYKVGKLILIDPVELDAWLEEQKVEAVD